MALLFDLFFFSILQSKTFYSYIIINMFKAGTIRNTLIGFSPASNDCRLAAQSPVTFSEV